MPYLSQFCIPLNIDMYVKCLAGEIVAKNSQFSLFIVSIPY